MSSLSGSDCKSRATNRVPHEKVTPSHLTQRNISNQNKTKQNPTQPNTTKHQTGAKSATATGPAIELLAPVDPTVVKRLTTEPKTMKHFFQRKPNNSSPGTKNDKATKPKHQPSPGATRRGGVAKRAKSVGTGFQTLNSSGSSSKTLKRAKTVVGGSGGGASDVMRSFFGMAQPSKAKAKTSSTSPTQGGQRSAGARPVAAHASKLATRNADDDVAMVDLVDE
jgi:hypothetical protein